MNSMAILLIAETPKRVYRPVGLPSDTEIADTTQPVLAGVHQKPLGGRGASDLPRTSCTSDHREALSTATYIHRLLPMEDTSGLHKSRCKRPSSLAVRFPGAHNMIAVTPIARPQSARGSSSPVRVMPVCLAIPLRRDTWTWAREW